MKAVYIMRSKTWLVLIGAILLFSTVNVYFLSPYRDTFDTNGHTHEAIHIFDHPDVRKVHSHDIKSSLVVRDLTMATTTVRLSAKNQTSNTTGFLRAEKTCPNLNIKSPLNESESFQPITGTSTFVYSAYLFRGKVRIIAIRKTTDPHMFYCHIWTNTSTDYSVLTVTRGYVSKIPEDHDRDYLASYIVCDLPNNGKHSQPPYAVSVVLKDKCSPPTNWLPVTLPATPQYNFTVCVTPFNRRFSNTHMLVEMVEFNKLLGAQRFVFYNHSIFPDIGKILHYYKDRGEVDLLQWPSSIPEKAHYFGQLASLNDCLYRYKTRSHYIVFQDLDEFIIPKDNHYNWGQLIRARLIHNPRVAVFQARCTFFRKEWPKPFENFPRNDDVKKYKSIVLGHTLREETILHPGHRSKYIINPNFVETVGIHDVWTRSAEIDRLDSSVALVYHYRDWQFPNDTQKRVEDTFVVSKYGLALIDRLAEAWDLIHKRTGLS